MIREEHRRIAYSFGIALLRERRQMAPFVLPHVLFRQYKATLTETAKRNKWKGKFKVGCYRIAFITEDVVYKFQYNETSPSSLQEEYQFIRQMQGTQFHRHFPRTCLMKCITFPVLIQERVNTDHKGIAETLHLQVKLLARKLGIEDCHSGNYGWKGRRQFEYPVFIDVDFRAAGPARHRSWFV